jgi:hypothetical protein
VELLALHISSEDFGYVVTEIEDAVDMIEGKDEKP